MVLGDIVRDDSGSCAVFAEQGSFAPQWTATNVVDVIARQQDCAGQAPDAVSAYSQVKNERRSKIIQNSKVRMSRYFGYVPRHKWPTSWSNIEVFCGSHWTKCVRTPTRASCRKDNLRKFHLDLDGHSAELGMLVCSQKTRIVFIGYVDDIRKAEFEFHVEEIDEGG